MKLVKKELLESSLKRYDLEIKDNHNFIASGIVVHNCNARYVFWDGQMYCGSRTEWKKEYASKPEIDPSQVRLNLRSRALVAFKKLDESDSDYENRINKEVEQRMDEIIKNLDNWKPSKNLWWTNLTPEMEEFCRSNPGYVLYGEIYGQIQKGFPYDCTPGTSKFRAFDILNCNSTGNNPFNTWMNAEDICWLDKYNIPTVPWIGVFDYNSENLISLAEGKSLLNPSHIREGIVVKPVKERYHEYLGRVSLKIVSVAYLEKK